MTKHAKVYKTCNCCLDRNKVPVLMGLRGKVRYCRSCKLRTVWSEADPALVEKMLQGKQKMQDLIDELLSEIDEEI